MDLANVVLSVFIFLVLVLITSLYYIVTDPHYVLTLVKGGSALSDIYEYEHVKTDIAFNTFLIACSQDNSERVLQILERHPMYINEYSKDSGDTCLHVAAILGQSSVTHTILQAGGNPNVRTRHTAGYRMTPLAWNVMSGHVNATKVLVEHTQTNINMIVDCMNINGNKVTALDLVYRSLPLNHNDDNHIPVPTNERNKKMYQIKQLLLDHGARTYEQLKTINLHHDDEL